jgi:DNA-binding FrmR family transcriptional regulator
VLRSLKPNVYTNIPSSAKPLAEQKRKDVSRRIARICGHVHGIAEMLDEGKPCSEIVHQTSTMRALLDSVMVVIVDDLVEDRLRRAAAKGPATSSLEELKRAVTVVR